MDIYAKYVSPLGYQIGDDLIDSYGVNHNKFKLRDEIEYQHARIERENKMMENYKARGIDKDYPQYTTNFWNTQPENNYGFGDFDIKKNIENMNHNKNQGMQYAQNVLPNVLSDGLINNNVDYSLYGTDFDQEFIDNMLQDKDYQRALQEYAIPNEGGYVNNKNDPGGETNMGISKRYHPYEDIKNLTRERANALLYKEIWNWNGINKLPREIKGFVFDYGIRTGPQNAIQTTHKALNIIPIGDVIGHTTLNRLQNTTYEEFLRKYKDLIREQDRNNANYKYFGTGWNNRTDKYHVSY